MTANSPDKRALMARANRLKSRITLGKAGPTDALIAQIRQALDKTDLIKVRIQQPDRDERRQIAHDISQRVPCELVALTGFVATLYRRHDAPRSDNDASTGSQSVPG